MTDKIEIPIEIKLTGKKELGEIQQEVDNIEKKLNKNLKKKARREKFVGGTSPLSGLGGDENFAMGELKKPVPIRGELAKQLAPSTKSNLTPQNQFKALQARTEELERQQKKAASLFALPAIAMQDLLSFAKNPIGFFTGTILTKLSKGAGLIFLVQIIFEAVKFIVNKLYEPGMPLDRRFKRVINEEILLFQERMEKAEKRQGFREVRITTRPRLRGGRGQVSGNYYDLVSGGVSRIPVNFRDEPVDTKPTSTGARRFGKTSPWSMRYGV